MPHLSDAAEHIRQSVFARLRLRIEERTRAGHELIPLQIGDTYLPPPVATVAATREELAIYGSTTGLRELHRAILAERQQKGMATFAAPEQLLVAHGCTHALMCTGRAVLSPGDEVLVFAPHWPLIGGVLRTVGAVPVFVDVSPLSLAEPPSLTSLLAPHRTAKTRAIYFITPNNPDGFILDETHLADIAAFAQRHDLWVFADEVYADFAYDAPHRHIVELEGMAERTITTYSLSKSHGLAGIRIGYAIAPPPVVQLARRISTHSVYSLSATMQRVAVEALEGGAEWQREARARYEHARDEAVAALDAHGFTYRRPMGGAYTFVDLSPHLGPRTIDELLAAGVDAGVLVAPGSACGPFSETWARLCFTGVEPEVFRRGVERLARAAEGT
ncbi:MAG: pyridoxal phosphate-dependent aminotransferase [Myxococcota bacterium]